MSEQATDSGAARRGRVTDHVRAAILEAAIGLVAERGADVSMTELAEAAGVGRATLYRYFPTREDLVGALLESAHAEAEGRLEQARLDEVPFAEGVARAARALVAVGSRYLVLVREHMASKERPADKDPPSFVRLHLGGLIERGKAEGEVDLSVPTDWLMRSFGWLLLAALEHQQETGLGVEDAAELVARQFLDGARGRATRR